MVRLLFGFFGSTEQSMSSGPVTQVGKSSRVKSGESGGRDYAKKRY